MKKKYIFIIFLILMLGSISTKRAHCNPKTASNNSIDQLVASLAVFQSQAEPSLYKIHKTALVNFVIQLHPIEQAIYSDMVSLFSHYHSSFESFVEFIKKVRSYEIYFTSVSLDRVVKIYSQAIESMPHKMSIDPWVNYMMMANYPLSLDLEVLDRYWSSLLIYRDVVNLPSWSVFQKELAEVEAWVSRDGQNEQVPRFQWEDRFEAAWRSYKQSKAFALRNPTHWEMRETDLNLEVDTAIVLEKPLSLLVKDVKSDFKAFFKRVFSWDLLECEIDEDILLAKIKLKTGKVYDLEFLILEDSSSDAYKLYYILDIPFGKLKTVVSQWEIVLTIKRHDTVRDLSVLSVESRTMLTFSWAKKVIRLDKVKADLNNKLPIQVEALHAHFTTLE